MSDSLTGLTLRLGDRVRFRRTAGHHWTEAVVEGRERDGSFALRDSNGASRAIRAELIEVYETTPPRALGAGHGPAVGAAGLVRTGGGFTVTAAPARVSSAAEAGVPWRLWELHQATPVGVVVRADLSAVADRVRRADLIHGAGFAPVPGGRMRRLRTLADLVGPGLRMLCVGLNPSVYSADLGVGFARPGNRFWPAMRAGGLTVADRDPRHLFSVDRIGMTDLVKRATPRADELTREEYSAGVARLDRLCAWLEPAVVCVIGLEGWRAAVDRRAVAGWHVRGVGGRPAYVMPNPSGLNAHVRVDDLAAHLATAIAGPPAGPSADRPPAADPISPIPVESAPIRRARKRP